MRRCRGGRAEQEGNAPCRGGTLARRACRLLCSHWTGRASRRCACRGAGRAAAGRARCRATTTWAAGACAAGAGRPGTPWRSTAWLQAGAAEPAWAAESAVEPKRAPSSRSSSPPRPRYRAEVMKLEAVSQLDRLHVKDCETLHKIATARVIRSRASSPRRKLLHRRPATSLLPTCSFPPPVPL